MGLLADADVVLVGRTRDGNSEDDGKAMLDQRLAGYQRFFCDVSVGKSVDDPMARSLDSSFKPR